jgi:hypothetical protein
LDQSDEKKGVGGYIMGAIDTGFKAKLCFHPVSICQTVATQLDIEKCI